MPIREETQIKKETESKPRRRSSTLLSQSISKSQDIKKRKSSKIVKINKEKKRESVESILEILGEEYRNEQSLEKTLQNRREELKESQGMEEEIDRRTSLNTNETEDDSKFKEELLNDVKNDYPNEFANGRMEEENEENQQEQANDLIFEEIKEFIHNTLKKKVTEQLATIKGETDKESLYKLNKMLFLKKRFFILIKLKGSRALGFYLNESINIYHYPIEDKEFKVFGFGYEFNFLKKFKHETTTPNSIRLAYPNSPDPKIFIYDDKVEIKFAGNHLWIRYPKDSFDPSVYNDVNGYLEEIIEEISVFQTEDEEQRK